MLAKHPDGPSMLVYGIKQLSVEHALMQMLPPDAADAWVPAHDCAHDVDYLCRGGYIRVQYCERYSRFIRTLAQTPDVCSSRKRVIVLCMDHPNARLVSQVKHSMERGYAVTQFMVVATTLAHMQPLRSLCTLVRAPTVKTPEPTSMQAAVCRQLRELAGDSKGDRHKLAGLRALSEGLFGRYGVGVGEAWHLVWRQLADPAHMVGVAAELQHLQAVSCGSSGYMLERLLSLAMINMS
eukprot:jgi/Chrzof1/11494/UNPLg00426.t1